MFRVGLGWDQHGFVTGRPLLLGGERFEHGKGLKGHSDADVLVHAVCDALLGALGMGDLGRHFPDEDPQYKGADSLVLLAEVTGHMRKQGYRVTNLDTVIVAQEPRLAGRLDAMGRNLAAVLGCLESAVNVKAASPEGIGALGGSAGIAAQAIVLLERSAKGEGP